MYNLISVILCSRQDKHCNSTLRGKTEEEISLFSNKKFTNITHSFKLHTKSRPNQYLKVLLISNY